MTSFARRFRRAFLARPEPPAGQMVRAGAVYARFNAAHVVETALVLRVDRGGGSIPHVHYNCCLHRADRIFDDGPRTLALPTFLERFRAAA